MQITLTQLPYPYDALKPYVSRKTLEIHHGEHHRAYVEKARSLAREVRLGDRSLEQIIQQTAGKERHRALFNSAAQAWNHDFYWCSLTPKGGGTPYGAIGKWVDTDLGGYDTFAKQMEEAAAGQFGSGWVWLVIDENKLKVTATSNADTPLARGQTPLLTIDVWEHAYYLDYRNRRAGYVSDVIRHLLNWNFANRNLSRWTATAIASVPQIISAAGATQ